MSSPLPVISDAGPLMALGKLNRLDLLALLYETVQMPKSVYVEVVERGLVRGEPDARIVRDFWRRLQWPIESPTAYQTGAVTFQAKLGLGEQEVLALALLQPNALVLLDDAIARAEARRLGISAYGTLGILVQAYRQQHIPLRDVEFLIEEIMQRPDIWISEMLCRQVLMKL